MSGVCGGGCSSVSGVCVGVLLCEWCVWRGVL